MTKTIAKAETPTQIRRRINAEVAQLRVALDAQNSVRSHARKKATRVKEITEPWGLVALRMHMLSPQSYGSRLETYLMNFYGWERVAPALNRGDVQVEDGRYIEIKVSVVDSYTKVNFVQLRPHQDIDGYRLFVIDAETTVYRFDLTKEQMDHEIKLVGTNSHGTSDVAAANVKKEPSIRFKWSEKTEAYRRWMADYLVSGDLEVTPDLMDPYVYQDAATLRAHVGVSGLG
jgi:hypothetical protein